MDLDAVPEPVDPTVFVREPRLFGVWADGARLFWLTGGVGWDELKGCDVNACSETTTTYARRAPDFPNRNGFAVGGGRIVWSSDRTGLPDPESGVIRACSATDCEGTAQEILRGAAARFLACDETHVCFSEDFVTYCCPSSGCGTIPDVVTVAEVLPVSLTVAGGYVYWATSEVGSGRNEVHRARLDDLGTSALVATTTKPNAPFAVNSKSLYFAEAGGPTACHLPSCSERAPLVSGSGVGNVLEPGFFIFADESNVYWLETSPEFQQVKRCPIAGCMEPELLTNAGPFFQFALGTDYLYWIGYDDSAIRRIRK